MKITTPEGFIIEDEDIDLVTRVAKSLRNGHLPSQEATPSTAREVRMAPSRAGGNNTYVPSDEEVLAYLMRFKTPRKVSSVANHFHANRHTVGNKLQRLALMGLATRTTKGYYVATSTADTSAIESAHSKLGSPIAKGMEMDVWNHLCENDAVEGIHFKVVAEALGYNEKSVGVALSNLVAKGRAVRVDAGKYRAVFEHPHPSPADMPKTIK